MIKDIDFLSETKKELEGIMNLLGNDNLEQEEKIEAASEILSFLLSKIQGFMDDTKTNRLRDLEFEAFLAVKAYTRFCNSVMESENHSDFWDYKDWLYHERDLRDIGNEILNK